MFQKLIISTMKAKEAARLLANRINQEHYVESIMQKVFNGGLKEGRVNMTPPQALTLLRSGYFNIYAIARDVYKDEAPEDTKRKRLEWRIAHGKIKDEEIKFLENLFWDDF